MRHKWPILLMVSLVLFMVWFLYQELPPRQLYQGLMQIPFWSYPLLFGLMGVISWLKSWRFATLVRLSGINISLICATRVFAASQALTFLPGGELARGVLLKSETKAGLAKSAPAVLLQAYLEIAASATIMLLGSWWMGKYQRIALISWISTLAVYFLIRQAYLFRGVSKLIKRWRSWRNKQRQFMQILASLTKAISWGQSLLPNWSLVLAFMLAILSTITSGVLFLVIAWLIKLPLGLPESLLVTGTGLIIQFLSLIPGGVGLTEVGTYGILVGLGISSGQALLLIILYRCFTLLLPVVLGWLLTLIFYRRYVQRIIRFH